MSLDLLQPFVELGCGFWQSPETSGQHWRIWRKKGQQETVLQRLGTIARPGISEIKNDILDSSHYSPPNLPSSSKSVTASTNRLDLSTNVQPNGKSIVPYHILQTRCQRVLACAWSPQQTDECWASDRRGAHCYPLIHYLSHNGPAEELHSP